MRTVHHAAAALALAALAGCAQLDAMAPKAWEKDRLAKKEMTIEGDGHEFAFDGLGPGEWTFTVATDLDDEFEEVKLNIDTDLTGVALSFKLKPPPDPVPADNAEALKQLGYTGDEK